MRRDGEERAMIRSLTVAWMAVRLPDPNPNRVGVVWSLGFLRGSFGVLVCVSAAHFYFRVY